MEYKNVLIQSVEKIEAVWESLKSQVKDLKPEEAEGLDYQKTLLQSFTGQRFLVQMNPMGFARIGLPHFDNELLLLNIPFDCLIVLDK